MRSSHRLALATLAVAALGAVPARAETTICTVISSLPYTITAQGSYCLERNLSTNITTGAAITINTLFVVLDLNGFKIGGGGGGVGTNTYGVYANNRSNITIKNGNIRGFRRAVYIQDGGASQAHLVEDIRADENTEAGIWVEGRGNVIRNNSVVSTPRALDIPSLPDRDTFGIRSFGPGTRLINNDVTETLPVGASQGFAMRVSEADGSVIENNRIGNAAISTETYGIYISSGLDVLVVGNRIATMGQGVMFEAGADGKYRDNVTSGVSTPYTGGTDAGGNN